MYMYVNKCTELAQRAVALQRIYLVVVVVVVVTCELRPRRIIMHSLEFIYFLFDGLLFASTYLFFIFFVHHIAQKLIGAEQPSLKGGKMASINQMNTGTVSKAALRKLFRYGWSAYGPFLHCSPIYTVIKTSLQCKNVDWNTIYVGLQCSLEHYLCRLTMQYGTLLMSAYNAVWNTIYVGLQCSLEHYLCQLTVQSETLFVSAYSAVWNTI